MPKPSESVTNSLKPSKAKWVHALVLVAATWAPAAQACWEEASQRYGLQPGILYAIGKVESALNPDAVNLSHQARTQSVDLGLLQINSRWLPALAKFGITRDNLMEPCTNIHVGAWILAQLIDKHGDDWETVGRYNAACTQLKGEDCQVARRRYSWKVFRKLPATKDAVSLKVAPRVNPAPSLPPLAASSGLCSTVAAASFAPPSLPRMTSLTSSSRKVRLPQLTGLEPGDAEPIEAPVTTDKESLSPEARPKGQDADDEEEED